MTHRRRTERNARTDLRWGARWGFSVTAVTLLPAGLAALGASPSERRQFILVAAGYLGFGTLVGLLAGSLRPQLMHRRVAMALGGLVGAVGFVLLVSFRDARPTLPDFGPAL